MPACASRSPRDQDGRGGESAVSEVVGFLLIFFILSMVLVLSMFAFREIQSRAESAVVAVEAESVAQRVASAVVNAALFAERHGSADATYLHPLDLPDLLEGHTYVVHLDPATGATPAQVRVVIADLNLEAAATLFSADASTSVALCSTDAVGGRVLVRLGAVPSPCTGNGIFLVD